MTSLSVQPLDHGWANFFDERPLFWLVSRIRPRPIPMVLCVCNLLAISIDHNDLYQMELSLEVLIENLG